MGKAGSRGQIGYARWIVGSFALFSVVLLASHVLPRMLGYGPQRSNFAPDDAYSALATAAVCLGVVIVTRVLRRGAPAG